MAQEMSPEKRLRIVKALTGGWDRLPRIRDSKRKPMRGGLMNAEAFDRARKAVVARRKPIGAWPRVKAEVVEEY